MIGGRELVSLGLNHRTAPVGVRERLAITKPDFSRHFLAIAEQSLSDETVILSTCNRVELYAVVDPEDGGCAI